MSFPSTPFFLSSPYFYYRSISKSYIFLSLSPQFFPFLFTFYPSPSPPISIEKHSEFRERSRAQRDDANRASRRVHASRRERGPGLRAMRSLTHKVNLGLPVSGAGGNPTPPVGGKNREVRVWGTREMGRERDKDREV